MPSFPGFLTPLPIPGADTAGFAGAPQRSVLDVRMTVQEEENWCWASVTQAVIRFANAREVSQAAIASRHMALIGRPYPCDGDHRNEVLGNARCNDGSCSGGCNNMHALRIIMAEQGCYGGIFSQGVPPFPDIRNEIQARRPLPCRVQWVPSGGHFILISGWEVGADAVARIHVLDPSWNEGTSAVVTRVIAYHDFANAYSNTLGFGFVNFSYRVA